MSETDVDQALQLLSNQPKEIQQNERVRALRERLDAAKERDRRDHLLKDAIRDAVDALQKRELPKVLNSLEAARRVVGDTPELTAAITEYATKRKQSANGLLTVAIEAATQAIQQDDRPRAADELGRVEFAVEFADPGLQANWTSLSKASGRPASQPQAAWQQVGTAQPQVAAPAAAAKQSGGSKAPLFAIIAVVLLAAAGGGYWFFLRPAPVVALGVLELNATPYAEVVGVTSDKGKAIALPTGDRWTPLRIDDIPIGKYSVDFKGPDGSTQKQECDVEQLAQLCSVELRPIDDSAIEQIVGGAK